MTNRRFLLIVACLLLSVASVAAQTDRVDAYVRYMMERFHIPGLAMAVVKDGQVIAAKGYGRASLELDVPVTPETVFEIGSITKQFTAAAIMLLVEEGKVRLDDKISTYLPGLPETWSSVTVRHLLTHTSGIKSYTSVMDFLTLCRNDHTSDEIIRMVSGFPLEFQPGEKWAYSNTGYYLLGLIIEKASGRSYWDFLDERIFKPLGMTATRSSEPKAIIPHRARGYSWMGDRYVNIDPLTTTAAGAAGAIVSTVLDMARWDAALYTERVLKRSSLDQMWTPATLTSGQTTDYGFGWRVGEIRGHRFVQHGGGTPGFRSHFLRLPDDRLTIIILTNRGGSTPAGSIAQGIARLYLPDLREEPIEDKDPTTTAMSKNVLLALRNGTLDPDLFTAEARAALFPDQVKEMRELLEPAGRLRSFHLLERKDEGRLRHYRYRASFEKESWILTLTQNVEGKIEALNLWIE
ncbi:MAG TPA: serine hydrolase domain-containing protein [Blastocatellia bacterium]|nr:serine hydrolase domain-containing protein [Blastocatellia bacterium]